MDPAERQGWLRGVVELQGVGVQGRHGEIGIRRVIPSVARDLGGRWLDDRPSRLPTLRSLAALKIPCYSRHYVDFAQSDVAPALKPAAFVRGDRRLESRRHVNLDHGLEHLLNG